MLVLQRPAQVASVQHVSPVTQVSPAAHPVVPLTPQLIVCEQLFVTLLHCFAPQAICGLSGTQPHAPLLHDWPPAQPGHMTMFPQLSVDGPHRLSHQWGSETHRHRPSGVQPSPGAHVPVQFHVTPHESVPGLQRFWQKVRLGEHASPGASVNGPSDASDASSPAATSSALSCCVTSLPAT
jgi:hypothetical protein